MPEPGTGLWTWATLCDKEMFMAKLISLIILCSSLVVFVSCEREEAASRAPRGSGLAKDVEGRPLPNSKEALAAAYVAAINADDVDALRSLLHPGCLLCLSDENRDYYDELFAQYVIPAIPEGYDASFESIPSGEPLPFEDVFSYPVRPSHAFKLEYAEGQDHRAVVMNHIVGEDGAWSLMIPCPTAEVLTKYRESRRQAEQDRARATVLLSELEDPLRRELVEMLQKGERVAAIVRYGEASQESPAVAEAVVYLLAQEGKP